MYQVCDGQTVDRSAVELLYPASARVDYYNNLYNYNCKYVLGNLFLVADHRYWFVQSSAYIRRLIDVSGSVTVGAYTRGTSELTTVGGNLTIQYFNLNSTEGIGFRNLRGEQRSSTFQQNDYAIKYLTYKIVVIELTRKFYVVCIFNI